MLTFLLNKFFPGSKKRLFLSGSFIAAIIFLSACQTVKPYQRAYLNDESMQTGKRPIEKFTSNVHTYREGASGGGKGKSSGSCGCN